MKLTLAKKGNFLGTECDFYQNEQGDIFMSRTQIGYALQYKSPQDAIKKIHQRHFEQLQSKYIEIVGDDLSPRLESLGNKTSIFMYNEKGIYDVVRWSTTKVANEYFDWVYEIVQLIKSNGFYIATEKDASWLGIRQDGKLARRTFTDEIKDFVDYAKGQGSQSADKYYMVFTKLVNSKLGIPPEVKRDDLEQMVLVDVMAMERIIARRLPKLMDGKGYKAIYQEIKQLIMDL